MTEAQKGVAAMAIACIVWGLSAIYYKMLSDVPPLEVLAHRTLWSLVFFGLVLTGQRRLGAVPAALRAGGVNVCLAAVMISANWFLFIFSVQAGHAVEASLGYYIFPLMAVLLGRLVFGERLSRGQAMAVALAVGAVLVLTLALGVAPWIALAIAATFGLYGVAKKRMAVGPMVSVAAEVLVLAPLALIWLWGVHHGHWSPAGRDGGWFGRDLRISGLLVFSGVLTGGPLMLFAYATRRVSLATIGLVQYINPTLQFLVAVLIFAEPFTRWHGIAFALIWTALMLYTLESLRQDRAARRLASSDATSGTVVK